MNKCIITEDSYFFPKDRIIITDINQIRHLLKLKYLLLTDEPDIRIFDSKHDIINICKKYDKKLKGYNYEIPKPNYEKFAKDKELAKYQDLGRIQKHLQLNEIKKIQPMTEDSDYEAAIKFKNGLDIKQVNSMYYFLGILSTLYKDDDFHQYIYEVDLQIRNFNISEQDALLYLHALRGLNESI